MSKKLVKKKECKHLNLTHLDTDQMSENKVFKLNEETKVKEIVEYDDVKIFVFNCIECGEIITKPWLRCHFKRDED